MRRFFYFLFILIIFSPSSAQQPTDKLLELYNMIHFNYVDSVDGNRLVEAAIQGMLEELDPHSVYIGKEEVEEINEALNGSFEGIGVQFDMYRDTVLVISPIFGGPSEKLGILSGDKIISADGKLMSGMGFSDEEVISTLRGKKGSQVKIQIQRHGVDHLIDFLITRDHIPIYSVDAAYLLEPGIGYIKVNRFSKTTMEEFKKSMKSLHDQGLKDLILDLRGNGGGFLVSAVELADEFIDSKEVIVSTKGRSQRDLIYRASPGGLFPEGKLIILIDEGTASASEIVAGAIQDLDRGIIIGRRSFGKGLVMKPYYFSDGSMIRLTTSRYYTPSGRCIQKNYGDSRESYEHEIYDRFDKGELFTMDSILPNDSLIKYTASGRKVYGGGGIYPDIFISADTFIADKRYQEVIRSGNFSTYSLAYVEAHRNDLLIAYKSAEALIRDEEFSKKLFDEFNDFLVEQKLLEVGLEPVFQHQVSIQLKAFLARNLWNDRSYYKVINHRQPVIEKALNLLTEEQFSWEKLSYK